ncbi:MAG: hypothetical protein LBB98_14125 [Treponema sp.]|jgi:hypothetical protein|nr:hypothetical protein [Treponema sp.]
MIWAPSPSPSADTFQTTRNEFGTLLGDMQTGADFFNQINTFNDKTPFPLDTLNQATQVLLAAEVPLADLQNHRYTARFHCSGLISNILLRCFLIMTTI